MHRSATRPLSLLVVVAAFAIAAAAPAQAFTPPIGSDKGSVTDTPPTIVVTKYYDMSSPYLKSDHSDGGAASASSTANSPDANGIIAILIG